MIALFIIFGVLMFLSNIFLFASGDFDGIDEPLPKFIIVTIGIIAPSIASALIARFYYNAQDVFHINLSIFYLSAATDPENFWIGFGLLAFIVLLDVILFLVTIFKEVDPVTDVLDDDGNVIGHLGGRGLSILVLDALTVFLFMLLVCCVW